MSSSPPTTSPAAESPTDTDESPSFSQAHVRALPRDQAARQDHGHLHQPATQAKAGVVLLPGILAGLWPAITRRQSPPSSLPRLLALAADECGLWLGARDPETRQHHWKEH